MKKISLFLVVFLVVGVFHTGVSKLRQKEAKASVAVEFLTFRVNPSGQESFFRKDTEEWSLQLQDQQNFIKKEIWKDQNDISLVHMVIYWQAPSAAEAISSEEGYTASEIFNENTQEGYDLIGSRYFLTEKDLLFN